VTRPSAVCAREADVLAFVAIGQWPDRADDQLRAHVDGCLRCRETAAVASAVIAHRDAVALEARLPDASVVWLAADRRVRADAARQAERPIAAAEVLAITAGTAAVGAGVMASGLVREGLDRWSEIGASVRGNLPSAGAITDLLRADLSPVWPWVLVTGGALALVTMVAVSIAALADR